MFLTQSWMFCHVNSFAKFPNTGGETEAQLNNFNRKTELDSDFPVLFLCLTILIFKAHFWVLQSYSGEFMFHTAHVLKVSINFQVGRPSCERLDVETRGQKQ